MDTDQQLAMWQEYGNMVARQYEDLARSTCALMQAINHDPVGASALRFEIFRAINSLDSTHRQMTAFFKEHGIE